MNRRSFLRGLIAAPAIVAASSIMPVRAIERFATLPDDLGPQLIGNFSGFRGGDWITFPDPFGLGPSEPRTFRVTAISNSRSLTISADDFFKSNLRDTAEPQAPVSPDNQNGIPTAQADDLCHFGQDTETLSPNVSRRLLRAWGVNEGRAGDV